MPNLEIKTANSSDAALLESLAKEIWTQHYVNIITMAQITFMLEHFQSKSAIQKDLEYGAVYDIAYFDDQPCGYSATMPDETGLYLSKLYVKQSCRGQGVARALMSRVDKRAKSAGLSRIWLKCNKRNTNSLAAYERLGFTVAYDCVTDIGGGFVMDDYALEKAVR